MDKIRMLHFADLHVGMENYGKLDPQTGISGRVLDFLRRFNELIDWGLEREVDLVIFAGDAFKTRDPNPTYQREFARRVKRLADADVPIVLLVGNHDLPAMTQKASSVDIFDTLDVPNVIVGRREEVHRVETRRGLVQVVTVPYPVRSRLLSRSEYRGLSMAELDRALQQVVTEMIEALKAELDPDLPAVLVGHFSVGGATYGSERGVMLGRDVVVPKSTLTGPHLPSRAAPGADPAFDYVALGHIHKHQNLTEKETGVPPVVYAGSLERIDFGEEGQPKGFCWVELARGATQWEFVPVNARPFVTIRADLRRDDEPTQTLLETIARHEVRDAVVRLIVQTTPETEARLVDKEVEKALEGANYIAAFIKETERPERIRLGGASPESLTPAELLERYLESRETPPERAETLLRYAEKLFETG